jgi:ATP-dependent exoDNAse (exonuclease V) beta subunit
MTTAGPYVRALRARGLEVHAQSSGGFFTAPEVADVRALLATVAYPRDDAAVIALLAGGLGGVSDDGLYRIARRVGGTEGVWGALESVGAYSLDPADDRRCWLVYETVERLRSEQGRVRLADALLDAVESLGPGGGCLARDGAWANLRKIARIATELERAAPADPAALLSHLEERDAFVKHDTAAGLGVVGAAVIRLMTVHAAKGLEFPIVAVGDLGHETRPARDTLAVVRDGTAAVAVARLPTSYGDGLPTPSAFERAGRDARARALEEDKRVFYVACTRAEELLILSGGAMLAKAPGESLAIDWVRTTLGDPGSPGLPGVRVTVVTAHDEADLVDVPTSVHPLASPVRAETTADRSPGLVGSEMPTPPADLSYTALALYERCPFRFFTERVLGIGSLDDAATDVGGPRELGQALHGALQLLAEGDVPDAARLDALARYHRLDAQGRVRLGAAVATFRATSIADAIGGLDARAEVDFSVRVGHGTLVGKLDLLARDSDMALIVDYKTGATELDTKEARVRFQRQAEVYALALLRAGTAHVQVSFVEVERGGRETRFDFGPGHAEELESRIGGIFASIAAGDYPRLSSFDHGICQGCAVAGSLCPIVRPGTKSARSAARA